MEEVRRIFDVGWQIARVFTPSIGSALVNVILNPVALVIGWLLYGLLAFLSARALGGRAGWTRRTEPRLWPLRRVCWGL